MKPIHALAIVGALAAGPALAQEYPSGPVGQPQVGSQAVGAAQGSEQAVQAEFLAQIQQELQREGLYDGPIDGIYGDQTQSALAEWQRRQNIEPTGQLNAETLAAMDLGAMATQQAEVPEHPDQAIGSEQRTEPPPGDTQEEARQPGQEPGEVETLREEKMSAPNVEGEAVPERPDTGVPAPGRSPESLEQPQDR